MNIKNATLTLVISALAVMQTGCASLIAKKYYDDDRRSNPIRVEADGQSVMVGVDILSTEYLADNWKVAIPAAILDGIIAYKTYDLLSDKLTGGGKESQRNNEVNISGNDQSSININISGDSDNDTANDNDTDNEDSNNNYN